MRDTSLFIPDAISDALRTDLAGGLRAIAEALDRSQLAGRYISSNAGAGGRNDERLHLRIVFDLAAPIVQSQGDQAETAKLTE